MSFTYVGDLSTDLDRTRFHINDTVEDAGPRPSDGNFSDAELNGLITSEGSWQSAVGAALERLGNEWLRYPSFKADGLSLNRSDIAKGYLKQAEQWRKQFPQAVPSYVAGQINVDGYSDDVPNNDVSTDSYQGRFEYVRPK